MRTIQMHRDSRGRFISNNGQGLYAHDMDPIAFNQMTKMVDGTVNEMLSRKELISQQLDKRRDIDDECGYKKDITTKDYRHLYDREAIATRVVDVLPEESWMVQPLVIETEEDTETPFEAAWKELGDSLAGDSWYKDEEKAGSSIWEHLNRADKLSGIGSFGVLLLGLDDGADLDQPINLMSEGGSRSQPNRKLLFLRSFDESLITIENYNKDVTDRRFGHPENYLLSLTDPEEEHTAQSQPTAEVSVHWTRVIHLADNLGSSELFGAPRMRPVWNRLMDLRKLYGSSAEMYWRGAFFGLSLETHPQLGGQVDINTDQMRSQMEQYMNGLQRYLALKGMSAKSLSPQVVDPSPQINAAIEAICIKLGIPKRIFMGSERGELASSQDAGTWNNRLRNRQENYITPRIIVPFVNRLIQVGVLPVPKQFNVSWPDLESLSEDEQATIATKRMEAASKYIGGNIESIMVPVDFYTRVLGMPEEEAEAVVEAAAEAMEEKEEEEAKKAEEAMKELEKQGQQPPQPGQPENGQQPPEQVPPQAGGPQRPFEQRPTGNIGDEADFAVAEYITEHHAPGKHEQAKHGKKKGGGKLTSGSKLRKHIDESRGSTSFTDLQLEKIKILNPNGTADGVVKVPKAINDEQLARLKKTLPKGTEIRRVNASASKIGIKGPKGKKGKIKQKKDLTNVSDGPGVKDALGGKPIKLKQGKGPDRAGLSSWKKGLTEDQRTAVEDWSEISYSNMRRSIAKGKPSGEAREFMTAIKKSPAHEGVAYRGLDVSSKGGKQQMQLISAAGVGGTWSDKAPMSMSLSPDVGMDFALSGGGDGLLMRIKSKTGRPIFNVADNPGEREIVGLPKKRYRITGITKHASVAGAGGIENIKMLVDLEEL